MPWPPRARSPHGCGIGNRCELVRHPPQVGCSVWVCMGNQYHLVTTTGAVPLWRSMARLQRRVARGFNRRRRYLGRLWRSRYRARVIDSEDYFRQVISYVHLNPVAAGIVNDPAEYPHSGHIEILGRREPRLIDVPAVLVGFDDDLGPDARERYLAWVRAVAEARWCVQVAESWNPIGTRKPGIPRPHRRYRSNHLNHRPRQGTLMAPIPTWHPSD